MRSTVQDESGKVRTLAKKGAITSVGRAAAYVRGVARRSISTSAKKGPSKPGSPPRSPTQRLKNSIAFNVDKTTGTAVIGPVRSAIAGIGHTHEFSGNEPPKQQRSRGGRSKQLRLEVGGIGPIRRDSRRRRRNAAHGYAFAVLKTQEQVRRAQLFAAELKLPPSVTGVPSKASRRYPARPFMGPALRRSVDRLPPFWRNSLRA